ncbi:MAG: MFS transporter [Beijerinckiaceae bacterium]|nr:MFS transporter [Beijerinckiaceae bacterium]
MSGAGASRSLLLFSLCLAGLAANVSGRTVEPLVTIISAEFSIGVATAALLTSAYALPFALGQPVLGPFGDMVGKARILRFSLWALTGALFLAALAPTFEMLAAARFCAGLAAGGVVPACMATIGDSYPPERRQVAISTFVTMGLLAQIFATSASGLIGEALGWRAVLFGTAVMGLVGALAATFVLRAAPPDKPQRFSVGAAAANYRIVFRNPKAILCYATVFLEGVALYGIMPYVGDILTRQGAGGAAQAGMIIGAIGVGGLVYVALVAQLLRRFNRRQFMAAGGAIMTVGLITLAMGPPWQASAAAFAVTGFGFMLLHNSIQTEAVDLAPGARQSAYSLHAFSFFSGQAAGPPVFGAALALMGDRLALLASAIVLATTGFIISSLFERLARKA